MQKFISKLNNQARTQVVWLRLELKIWCSIEYKSRIVSIIKGSSRRKIMKYELYLFWIKKIANIEITYLLSHFKHLCDFTNKKNYQIIVSSTKYLNVSSTNTSSWLTTNSLKLLKFMSSLNIWLHASGSWVICLFKNTSKFWDKSTAKIWNSSFKHCRSFASVSFFYMFFFFFSTESTEYKT